MSTVPFRVKSLFEYSSPHEDDLQFPAGIIITVTEEEDADWYNGEYVDDSGVKHEGIFPRNFVEKFEPQAPPRPTRTRTKKEPEAISPVSELSAPAPHPAQPAPQPVQEAQEEEEEERPVPPIPSALPASPEAPGAAEPAPVKAPEPVPEPTPAAPAPKPSESPAATSPPIAKAAPAPSKPGPPPKPSSNVFKDRIAAFNKASAAPITPFKPSGLSGGSGFIKKPFVAPPPSRNAYVPPPQQAPIAKIYRRDEDPEIQEREAETQETAEKAAAAPATEGGDDAPKPLSLKERMALLQKQQMEQAQRHADAAAKKEKAKRPPPKKRADSHEAPEEVGSAATAPEAQEADQAAARSSVDSARAPPAPRRKASRGPAADDGNDADMSGAGDTTEGLEDLTERDDSDAAPRPTPRPQVASSVEARKDEEPEQNEEEGEEEEDDVDPEIRRKEELRARMAKMSGGMGMHGMFGIPMGAPAPPRKKRIEKPTEAPVDEEREETTSPVGRVPVPGMMALSGMGVPRRSEEPGEADEPERPTSPRAPPPPPRTVEQAQDEPVTSPPPTCKSPPANLK